MGMAVRTQFGAWLPKPRHDWVTESMDTSRKFRKTRMGPSCRAAWFVHRGCPRVEGYQRELAKMVLLRDVASFGCCLRPVLEARDNVFLDGRLLYGLRLSIAPFSTARCEADSLQQGAGTGFGVTDREDLRQDTKRSTWWPVER